jgi:outer membrane receptor protein involved in Fe transport
MKRVEVPSEDKTSFVTKDCRRFHDDYFSLFGQLEAGVTDKSWADEFFVSASISKIDKELQTGSLQSWVYGMAERNTESANVSVRYNKADFLVKDLDVHASLSQTWDHSQTVDTVFRKYYWDGSYIKNASSEIRGRGKSLRHYKRPMTIVRGNAEYRLNDKHSLNLNYVLNRAGNKQYDEMDKTYVPTNDVLVKHIVGLSYNQSFLDGKLNNVFFLKDYINHLKVEQTELSFITGSDEVKPSNTQSYWGYGVGTRLTVSEPWAIKASYEHSVRLPIARELLGNGSTIYPNIALRPESSENFNLGLFGNITLAPSHHLYYEVNGFIRLVDDYIKTTVKEQEGMMQYENVEAVHIKGVEGEVRYDWADKLGLMLNASYQDSRDQRKYLESGALSATYNNRVPNKPWTFVNAEASYAFHNVLLPDSKLKISMDYQWVHWFYLTWEAYGSAKTKPRIPEQNLINAAMQYSWKDGRYNLSLECTNLFDRLAYDNYMLQKPGRAFFAKFRLFIH